MDGQPVEKHLIDEVDFSGRWCRCTCGYVVVSATEPEMPLDWTRHRKEAGQLIRGFSDAIRADRSSPWKTSMTIKPSKA